MIEKNHFYQLFVFLDDDEDEEEEDEDEEAEPGYEEFIKESRERESAREIEKHRDLYNQLEQEDDVAKMADYFKSRYSNRHRDERFGSSDELSSTIIQQKLLPGVKYVLL